MVKHREERSKRERNLSEIISARWYRPPEIILLDPNYDKSVDIWSLGCSLAELLYCSTEYSQDPDFNENQRYPFMGSQCAPMSPINGDLIDDD